MTATLRTGGRVAVAALLALALLVPVHADQRYSPAPARALSAPDAAARVLDAWRSGDRALLADLAENSNPDPWLVAEELRVQGHADAASAFAAGTEGDDYEALSGYVTTHPASEADRASARRINEMFAHLRRADWAAALHTADESDAPLDTVSTIRLAFLEAFAAIRASDASRAARVYASVAEAAQALGWIALAQQSWGDAGEVAYRNSDWPAAEAAWSRQHHVAEKRSDSFVAGRSLTNRGVARAQRGMLREALRDQRESLAIKYEIDDAPGIAESLANIAHIYEELDRFDDALEAYGKAMRAMKAVGDLAGIASTLGNVGIVHLRQSRYEDALRHFGDALRMQERLQDTAGVARNLGGLGATHEQLGAYSRAERLFERALALYESIQDRAGAVRTRGNLANIYLKLGDLPRARQEQQRVYEEKVALDDRKGAALTLGNLGLVYDALSCYEDALSTYEKALAAKKALDDRSGVANTLACMGHAYLALGNLPRALTSMQEARRIQLEIEDPAAAARTLGSIAVVLAELGEEERALGILHEVLQEMRDRGHRPGEAWTLGRLGWMHVGLGELHKALARYREALELMIDMDEGVGSVHTLISIGMLERELGAPKDALVRLEQAKTTSEALGDAGMVAWVIGEIGLTYQALGKPAQAAEHLEDAILRLNGLHTNPQIVRFLGAIARLHLESGAPERALAAAQRALPILERILGGLGEEQGAFVRAQYADVFSVGALAAARVDRPALVSTFLESGRAGLLLEGLRGRRTLNWGAIPPALRRAEAVAKAAESRCVHDLEMARVSGLRQEIEACEAALMKARDGVRDVSARIQREAKHQAGIFYPRPAALSEIQAGLKADTVLVMYGLCLDEVLALVVRRDEKPRVVMLGDAAPILEASATFTSLDPDALATRDLETIRALIVEPLALPAGASHVLVSPDGPLAYLPLSALLAPRSAALTPSGTTHLLLTQEPPPRGTSVLALGDPAYGRRSVLSSSAGVSRGEGAERFLPLPGSGKEARAVGDVVLLGEDANEERLFREIAAQKRWRSVHLACHGRFNEVHPLYSLLAVSPAGTDDDGLITCHDLLWASVPADLVVLSACRTARGRVYRGEGILGLTRAFMYAGAPCVLCSLWNVDDDATFALMKEFYALWHPRDGSKGHDAATALRMAQEHVASHEAWKHPKFWAAWVLWGDPR